MLSCLTSKVLLGAARRQGNVNLALLTSSTLDVDGGLGLLGDAALALVEGSRSSSSGSDASKVGSWVGAGLDDCCTAGASGSDQVDSAQGEVLLGAAWWKADVELALLTGGALLGWGGEGDGSESCDEDGGELHFSGWLVEMGVCELLVVVIGKWL